MKLVTVNEKSFLDTSVNANPSNIVLPVGGTIYADSIQPATSGGNITIGNRVAGVVKTATATSDGLTTGILTSSEQFVTVTSSSANNIITLPVAANLPIGTVIQGVVVANGFKLQVAVADATTVKLNNVTTNVKAAIPANVYFKVQLTSATTWLLTTITNLGAYGTAIVPA
jgi:hypothetical protein